MRATGSRGPTMESHAVWGAAVDALVFAFRRGGQHGHGHIDESEINKMGIGGLVWLGASLGVVHVLTGPDHMSALAQLSCGARSKGFWLGLRWGLGHSSGLLLMYAGCLAARCLSPPRAVPAGAASMRWGSLTPCGTCATRRYAIFMASGEHLNLDEIGEHVDTIVGVVLIAMGLYGLAQVRVSW